LLLKRYQEISAKLCFLLVYLLVYDMLVSQCTNKQR